MKSRHFLFFLLAYTCFITLPFLMAWLLSGDSHVFMGYLLNQADALSYQAKMRQGFDGGWKLIFPYGVGQTKGAYLMVYYYLLGHLARWLNLSIIFVFHAARLINSIIMLVLIRYFSLSVVGMTQKDAGRAVILAGLGSGLGWFAVLFGILTPDFWVAESYPFLASFANPHFPLAISLMVLAIIAMRWRFTWQTAFIYVLLGLCLSLVLPFAGITILIVLFITILWDGQKNKGILNLFRLALVSLGGAPIYLYQWLISKSDPVFADWTSRTLTLSDPLGYIILGYSPGLLMAVVWIYFYLRQEPIKVEGNWKSLIVWLLSTLLLMYLPFQYQRRFSVGIFIPVAFLAVAGIAHLNRTKTGFNWLWPVTLAVSIMTNIIILVSGLFAIINHNPAIYITTGEAQALQWIDKNTNTGIVVLSSPEIGLAIPAWTGRRAVYGHPMETYQAEQVKKELDAFFSCSMTEAQRQDFIQSYRVGILFIGPREKNLSSCDDFLPTGFEPVFSSTDTTLYALQE